MSQQLDAIFVALKLQLQNRTCKPGAIFSAICRHDIAGVLNMYETSCNFAATKIALSCRDKNRLCKRAFSVSPRINTIASRDQFKPIGIEKFLCELNSRYKGGKFLR